MKRSFFQAAVVSILLYGCTTWTLTKRLEKKLHGNYTRMLRAILNKSWRQHPTRHQLHGHPPPITKTIQARRTRHAGHCWRIRDELISDVLLWTPTYCREKAGRPARTCIQQLWDVALKTCRRRWTIGRSGERGSGIFVLAVRYDDDENELHSKCTSTEAVLTLKEMNKLQVWIANFLQNITPSLHHIPASYPVWLSVCNTFLGMFDSHINLFKKTIFPQNIYTPNTLIYRLNSVK